MSKVFIGVGHGGSDPGAVANGFKEKDLNLDIAVSAFNILERHGVDVKLSRVGDEDDTLEEEIRECNEYNPTCAIDIHNNAGGGDGVEAFYHYGGGLSKTLADNVVSEIVEIGQNCRGTKIKKGDDGRDWYGFIRETACPAVIVECAFVDNAKDMQIIDTKAEREKMGEAIAKGILATLGLTFYEKVEQRVPDPEPVIEKEQEPVPEDTPKEEPPVESQETPSEETLPEPTEDKGEDANAKKRSSFVEVIIAVIEFILKLLKGE